MFKGHCFLTKTKYAGGSVVHEQKQALAAGGYYARLLLLTAKKGADPCVRGSNAPG